jgi:hypothetical protein
MLALLMLSTATKQKQSQFTKVQADSKIVGKRTESSSKQQYPSFRLELCLILLVHKSTAQLTAAIHCLIPAILRMCSAMLVGVGHHLFVALVSRQWQTIYASLKSQQRAARFNGKEISINTVPQMTFFSSAFASPSRVKLAVECGLDCASPKCQYAAGKHADVATLTTAFELGLEYTSATMHGTSQCNKIAEVHFLHAQGCPWSDWLLEVAARCGHFELLRWCYEHGCPWNTIPRAPQYAAESGNVELMAWVLQQSGAQLDLFAMHGAALKGDTAMCQYLHAQQCPWNEESTTTAATTDHVDLLRWLIENGCPWDTQQLCRSAAEGGSVAVLANLQQQGILTSAAGLTNMLNEAASGNKLAAVKWLRAQGVEWPIGGVYHLWHNEVLEWARTEGFTPPDIN